MHLPDGLVGVPASAVLAGASVVSAGLAARKARGRLGERQVPLLASCAAFIFAAQMLNFPVGPGVSGHFLGAALAAVLFGLLPAVLIMTVVVVLQCAIFGDGGFTALGPNVFNMAVLAPAVAWTVYHATRRLVGTGRRGTLVATSCAAWVSVVVTGASCALLVSVFGSETWFAPGPTLALVGAVHAIIGVGEAVITASALSALLAARPDLVTGALSRPTPEVTL